jgi:hypothetical protein
VTCSFVSPRIVLLFTSSTAASIATFATFPTVVLKFRRAPILTTFGLAVSFRPIPFDDNPLLKTITATNKTLCMMVHNPIISPFCMKRKQLQKNDEITGKHSNIQIYQENTNTERKNVKKMKPRAASDFFMQTTADSNQKAKLQ